MKQLSLQKSIFLSPTRLLVKIAGKKILLLYFNVSFKDGMHLDDFAMIYEAILSGLYKNPENVPFFCKIKKII